MCKDHTSSHEITNEPYASSNYENTTKTLTADLTKTMALRRTPHMMQKSRSSVKTVKTTSEGGANSELDKDTDRSNLKIVSLALPLNIPSLLLFFIGFHCCNVRFSIACKITVIIVKSSDRECWFALRVELYVLDNIDDCDLLQKVVNITNVHEHNDVIVSIKVQQSRSRCAKYVYYNCIQQEIESVE